MLLGGMGSSACFQRVQLRMRRNAQSIACKACLRQESDYGIRLSIHFRRFAEGMPLVRTVAFTLRVLLEECCIHSNRFDRGMPFVCCEFASSEMRHCLCESQVACRNVRMYSACSGCAIDWECLRRTMILSLCRVPKCRNAPRRGVEIYVSPQPFQFI